MLTIFVMYYMNIVSININLKVPYKYSNSVIDTLRINVIILNL